MRSCARATTARISRGITLGLDLERAVKCSNFIGEAFDHAAYRGYPEILLVGHAGKLVKMAAGVMNTHSSIADARQEIFTAHAALYGAPRETLEGLMAAISVDACVELLDEVNLRQPVPVAHWQGDGNRIALRMKGRRAWNSSCLPENTACWPSQRARAHSVRG